VNGVSELLIRPLDAANDADMDGFQDVYAASELAEDPDAALYSREDGIAMMTSGNASVFDAFGAFDGDRMVGESILTGSLRDNLELGQVLLWVDPAHRQRGVGGRLLDHLEEHALTVRGRRILRCQARVGDGMKRNQRFAEQHGYSLVMTEIERRLPLPADPAVLGRLADDAAPYHEGYEIRAFVGRVAPELLQSYVDIQNMLIVEAPHGDLEVEAAGHTVEDLEARYREAAEAGRTSVAAVAVRDGAVVAYAHGSVAGGEARHVDQYGTLVHPDHRGHRLGMAVKCAQLRAISERFPEKAYIQTSNAEVNAHMVAINVALGFEIHQVWGEFEKRMGPDAPAPEH
jgi:GNAT superfamily N-acetyltransferase